MNESLDKLHSFQKQPEALQLADWLDDPEFYGDRGLRNCSWHSPLAMKASAELRRLHAANQELRKFAQAVVRYAGTGCDDFLADSARAAIAKATGGAA